MHGSLHYISGALFNPNRGQELVVHIISYFQDEIFFFLVCSLVMAKYSLWYYLKWSSTEFGELKNTRIPGNECLHDMYLNLALYVDSIL